VIWLCLMTVIPYANFTVVQSPFEMGVSQGDNATLNCTFSRHLSLDKGAISWSRGGPGEETTVPLNARFALAYPNSFLRRGEGTLTIANVSLEDAGKYICRVLLWGTGEARGNGTQLHVYCKGKMRGHEQGLGILTIAALMTAGFYPRPVLLSWYQGNVRLSPTTLLQEYREPTGPLQAYSTLDLPTWGPRHTYTCQVGHPSLKKPLSTDYTHGE
uniref:Ig-like domain-containing protein n=1 Tax=Pelusios castaneus TaxID=367368 RepID=A0A8C8RR30_9SAUR